MLCPSSLLFALPCPSSCLQAEAVVHDFTPQEISNLLWAYAKLGHKPPHMLLVALWEGVGAGALSTYCGSMMAAPGSGFAAGSGGSGTASSRLSAFKPLELSMLLWALATLRVAPVKEWWEQFLQASYHKMQQQTPQVGPELTLSAPTNMQHNCCPQLLQAVTLSFC